MRQKPATTAGRSNPGMLVRCGIPAVCAAAVATVVITVTAYQGLHAAAITRAEREADTLRAALLAPTNPIAHHYAALSQCSWPGLAATIQQQKQSVKADFVFHAVTVGSMIEPDRPAEFESKLITMFQADKHLSSNAGYVTVNGLNLRYSAVPITASNAACVGCHNSLSHAPIGSASRWHLGRPVGAAVVYVPATALGPGDRALVFRMFGVSAGAALLMLAWLLYGINTLIAKPARRLLTCTEAIRTGELNRGFLTVGAGELEDLALSLRVTATWMRTRIAREEQLRALFQQFVPAPVAARALGKQSDVVISGGVHRVTVMVLNIRNFRLLMQNLPADVTVSTLNEFFTRVNAVVVDHGGLVSKYLGDSVLAIFGMPVETPQHSLNAITAATKMPRALRDLYLDLDEEHGWQLGVGVGLATGDAIVGNFGSDVHREYTILGDLVHHAHNLESRSKACPEEDTIIMDEATYRDVMSEVHVLDLGPGTGSADTSHAYSLQGFRNEIRQSIKAA